MSFFLNKIQIQSSKLEKASVERHVRQARAAPRASIAVGFRMWINERTTNTSTNERTNHRRRSSVNFGGDILSENICMKN